jgi:DNA-binding transcriptional ArsR family regulator
LPGADSMDAVFQALAEPSRRALVERLSAGPAPVSDLARALSTSLSATLQHLAVLERSGLVVSAKQGRVRTCRLRPDALTRAERWFAHRRKTLAASFDRLECYLANGEDLNG